MHRFTLTVSLALAMAFAAGVAGRAFVQAGRLVFIGTYTDATTKGIYAFRFDDRTGALSPLGLVAETPSPSFLATSSSGRFLFAVNEIGTFKGEKSGSVSSFAVDPATGKLTELSVQPTRGAAPCHLALDRAERYLAVANYNGGNFALLPVDAAGKLGPVKVVVAGEGSGPNRERQEGPHGHAVVFDPQNAFLIGSDLGIDKVLVYRFNAAAGSLTPGDPPSASLPPGSGPRHFAFHPNGKYAFSISELKSTITSFSWDAKAGRLATIGSVSTLPADFHGVSTTAEIVVHPNGQFVYGSNRGHDSIAVFAVNGDGTLKFVQHASTRGETPRNFAIDPSGRWLIAANQKSGTLAVFRIDDKTGALSPTGPLANVGSPVNVLFAR
jgi:6-phosphogluconolactonase